MSTVGWLAICGEFAKEQDVPVPILRVLDAFGRVNGRGNGKKEGEVGPAGSTGQEVASFAELEKEAIDSLAALPPRIAEFLDGAVDSEQAGMFSRRFAAVRQMLEELAPKSAAARVLRVGLAKRTNAILAGPPDALRVRAIIDFYYSYAGIVHYRTTGASVGCRAPKLKAFAGAIKWNKVHRGCFHGVLAGMTAQGPMHINVLRLERARFDFKTTTVLGPDSPADEPFHDFVARTGAIAATSGGFFLYSEPDTKPPAARFDPVGLLVTDGNVVHPPVYHRPAIVQDSQGHLHIVPIGLKGLAIHWKSGIRLHVGGVNNLRGRSQAPVAFNRAFRSTLPAHAGATLVLVGRELVAKSVGVPVEIPVGGFALTLPAHEEWMHLADRLPLHSRVDYHLPAPHGMKKVMSAVAGGPTLLEDGQINISLESDEFCREAEPATFTRDETFDQNMLPRLAIGLNEKHDMIVAAVDGRNFTRALGLTLKETATLMKALGCVQAINMDGGSSKRMVLNGKTVDLTTTEIAQDTPPDRVRPVHTALLAFAQPPGPGGG